MTGRTPRRYRLLLGLAGAVLVWERLWPGLWPVAAIGGVLVAVALLDLLPALPPPVHALVLAAFVVALVVALRHAGRHLGPADAAAARRRLERDSGLEHRPLAALDDRLAVGAETPAARRLWEAHLRRMAAAAERLTLRPPAPGMARREPWGIRAGVVLLLAVGLAAGAGDAGPRFARALVPQFAAGSLGPVILELWITPPVHTGAAPLFLDAARGDDVRADPVVEVPRGSTVLARAAGVGTAPALVVGDHETAFVALEEGARSSTYRAEAVIADGDRLAVRSGRRDLAAWSLRVTGDLPPVVAFADPPHTTPGALVAVAFEAFDDYGVDDVILVVRGADGDGASTADGRPIRISLPLAPATSVQGSGLHDLTAHPLAGEPTRLHLEARDTGGQIGTSDVVDVVLPEKTFSHPVARAIVAERKRLKDDARTVRVRVAHALMRLGSAPARFADDTVVSLALAVAAARLLRDTSVEAGGSVRRLLWDTALRIEEGNVPAAERATREAREQLWEALRRGADDEEIERLTSALQQALDRYLAAMASELVRRGERMPAVDPAMTSEMLRSDDLRALIETMRQLARTGARDAARQVLTELQRILDGLRQGFDAAGPRRELMEAHRLMQGLRELGQRQRALLDQTFRRWQAPPAAPDGGGAGEGAPSDGAAAAQEALRRDLGEQMLRLDGFLGEIPVPVGEAERAMRGAVDALRGDRLGAAVEEQGQAVERLDRALQDAAAAMGRRLGGMAGLPMGEGGGGDGHGSDVFGRSPGNGDRGFGAGPLEIPDRASVHRAEEILRELRRRAGERDRPLPERDYIERLLRRF